MNNQFEKILNEETVNINEVQNYILKCDLFDNINESNIDQYISFSKRFLTKDAIQFLYIKIQQMYLNIIESPEMAKLYYKYIAFTLNNKLDIKGNEELKKLMNMVRIRGYDSDIGLISYYYGMDIIKKIDRLKRETLGPKTFEFYKNNAIHVYESLIDTEADKIISKEFNEYEDNLIRLNIITHKKNTPPKKKSFIRNILNKKKN